MAKYKGQRWIEGQQRNLNDWLAKLYNDPQEAIRYTTQMGDQNKEMGDVLRKVAYDYANLGGLSPETFAEVQGLRVGQFVGDTERDRGTKGLATQKLIQQLQAGTSQLGVVSGGLGPDTKVKLLARAPGQSAEDYMQNYIANEMLGYLDPTAKRSAQEALARQNPYLFRAYSMLKPAEKTAPVASVDPTQQAAKLTQAAGTLDWNTLSNNLPGTVKGSLVKENFAAAQSPANWLKSYLTTAAQGLSADSRAGQLEAQKQLSGLEGEAEANRLGSYLNLARSLVNPTQVHAQNKLIGQAGALAPGDKYRRGTFGRRNLGLT